MDNIEMKIYEILGVKEFKKMAFYLRDSIFHLIFFKINKEKRNEMLYNNPSNYIMKKGHGLQDVKDFKKKLFFNFSIHFLSLIMCLTNFLMIIKGNSSILFIITNVLCSIINIYCIMLQRYNYIRLNQILKRGKIREQKQKDILCEKLKNEISNDLVHKIVNKKNEEIIISFDEFIKNATLKELKEYKEMIEIIKNNYDVFKKNKDFNLKIALEKQKTLKLRIKA